MEDVFVGRGRGDKGAGYNTALFPDRGTEQQARKWTGRILNRGWGPTEEIQCACIFENISAFQKDIFSKT